MKSTNINKILTLVGIALVIATITNFVGQAQYIVYLKTGTFQAALSKDASFGFPLSPF